MELRHGLSITNMHRMGAEKIWPLMVETDVGVLENLGLSASVA